MKKYWKVDYKGCMPSIKGHRFHPNLFYATREEMDKVLEKLYGREDEYKIIGIHSFDTMEEYDKAFPILGRLRVKEETKEETTKEEVYVPQEVRTLEERRKHRSRRD